VNNYGTKGRIAKYLSKLLLIEKQNIERKNVEKQKIENQKIENKRNGSS
jgi:hypothetical protein